MELSWNNEIDGWDRSRDVGCSIAGRTGNDRAAVSMRRGSSMMAQLAFAFVYSWRVAAAVWSSSCYDGIR